MSVSIFNCWSCDKPLTNKAFEPMQKYAFWCGKKCHDKYIADSIARSKDADEWSGYMAGENECPENLLHLIPEVEDILVEGTSSKPDKKSKKCKNPLSIGGRRCGKCGEYGHNARTCGRLKKKPAKKHSSAPGSKRKKYCCKNCGVAGHNSATCPKK